jgi:octaprenyl-diphosphate synthase
MERAAADLTATTLRLEGAAQRGVEPARTVTRLQALKILAGEVVARVEATLPAVAEGGPGVAGASARHLLAAGGKRVRPLLVVLAARAAGGPPTLEARAAELGLAQAAELTHAATLLHDDVLDDGRVRRGVPAARVLWGNAASVLGGDFLLVRALELAAASRVPGALDELLVAIARMIDGEALQLAHRGRADLDAAAYRAVVDGKTASLFAWCGRAGARVAGRAGAAEPLGEYGLRLGRAFQIVDDVLDVEGQPEALGKSVLCDLREGKLTLPVLYALEARPALRARLQLSAELDGEGPPPELAADVARAVNESGGAARARADAARETEAALAALAPLGRAAGCAPYLEALETIARELCARVT